MRGRTGQTMKRLRDRGFTLIELMVAVTILAIVVAIVSAVFHQSSVAWNSGTQRVEANVTARAVLNLMTYELMHAVAGDSFEMNVDTTAASGGGSPGDSQIRFWCLTVTNEPAETGPVRVARRIRYSLDDEGQILREEWWIPEDGKDEPGIDDHPYFQGIEDPEPADYDGNTDPIVLAKNVEELRFHGWPPIPGGANNYTDSRYELPRGVRIRLVITREDDISNVDAWSAGPDGIPDNEDDIGSW